MTVTGIQAPKYEISHNSDSRICIGCPRVRANQTTCAAEIALTNSQKPADTHHARSPVSGGSGRSLMAEPDYRTTSPTGH